MHYNCLIVDDEVELAKMTAEYFEMFDIKTQYVESAESCFDFLKDNETDMILLDINLKDGSGFEVCRKIREDYQLPILFISARQSDDDVLVGKTRLAARYLRKEFALKGEVDKARLYVSGMGVYSAFLNGTEIAPEELLKPTLSWYSKRVYFNTYYVTESSATTPPTPIGTVQNTCSASAHRDCFCNLK